MSLRGIRGAITVESDHEDKILDATSDLLQAIQLSNPLLKIEDIASALFTLTEDLTSVYPAKAARLLGWSAVPMMCAREIPVTNGLSNCIRVLLHWNTDLLQSQIVHVYLRKAASLRPDLINPTSE